MRTLRHGVLVLGGLVLALAGAAAATWWWLAAPGAEAPRVIQVPIIDATPKESNGEPVSIPVRNAFSVQVTRRPEHGRTAADGSRVVYVPAPSHIGADAVGIRACNDGGCSEATAMIRTGRPGLSALTSVETLGLVRRADQPLRPGTKLSAKLAADPAAVAVSVTVVDALRPGAVVLDAGDGPVVAVRARLAGATTSNLVIVPVARRELVIDDAAGGGLTADIVGTFTKARLARGGRFVAVRKTRVVELYTARDGRDATVSPHSYGAHPGIRAALVLATAQIGSGTAWVDFGRDPSRVDRTTTWGPSKNGPQRRSTMLVPVNSRGQFSLNYQHGSRIGVDVLGYFTGSRDASAIAGLYVPHKPATIFHGVADPHGRAITAPAPASAIVVTLTGDDGVERDLDAHDVGISSNRTIGTILPATKARVTVKAVQPLHVHVELLGYFVT